MPTPPQPARHGLYLSKPHVSSQGKDDRQHHLLQHLRGNVLGEVVEHSLEQPQPTRPREGKGRGDTCGGGRAGDGGKDLVSRGRAYVRTFVRFILCVCCMRCQPFRLYSAWGQGSVGLGWEECGYRVMRVCCVWLCTVYRNDIVEQ